MRLVLAKRTVKMAEYWPSYFFCVLNNRDEVEVNLNDKKRTSAILTEQTRLIMV